jgi:hypothetical protein
MMELTENFIKLLQLALVVTGVLSIFFTYIQYNLLVNQDQAGREAIILGNYLLDNKCLTYHGMKSLFDEAKLETATAGCFNYPHGSFKVELLDSSADKWSFEITENKRGGTASFTVSVMMKDTGEVKPARMTVYI